MKVALGQHFGCPLRAVRIPYSLGIRPAARTLTAQEANSHHHLRNLSTSPAATPTNHTAYRLLIDPTAQTPGGSLAERSSSYPFVQTGCLRLPVIMYQRRANSTKPSSKVGVTNPRSVGSFQPDHPTHDHADGHSHSRSIFHSHSHSHDEHDHGHDAEQIVQALQGSGDRGSQITLVGLIVNVGLTGAKGAAGWYMHSASLLADAGHSLSDLLGDFVTLLCWKLSRKPPSRRYPYGFSKFETLGTSIVSILLIGGALGIGFHSYHLLMEALSSTVQTVPPGLLHDFLRQVAVAGHQVPSIGHAHAHTGALDPNAAWFAAVSVLSKEWLYRITKKVADEEHSPVLYANAVHHRSDAYSSVVALFAILGSWFFPAIPLDPIGGLLVSVVIFQQGLELLKGAFSELTDAGISKRSHEKLLHALDPLLSPAVSAEHSHTELDNGFSPESPRLHAVRQLRAKRSGSIITVDLTVDVPSALTVLATSELEKKITHLLKEVRKEITDVTVKFHPVDEYIES